MARFMTRYGEVRFKSRKNPSHRKKKAPKRRKASKRAHKKAPKSKQTHSKKVGRWRCECRNRTVTCAGAKHSYKSHAAACGAYKRITSVKAVEGFVRRYGTKKTCMAVCGKTSPHRSTKKRSKTKKRKARRGRRNPPISRKDADAMRRILRRHGYLV